VAVVVAELEPQTTQLLAELLEAVAVELAAVIKTQEYLQQVQKILAAEVAVMDLTIVECLELQVQADQELRY
jgi:hypothetical protein